MEESYLVLGGCGDVVWNKRTLWEDRRPAIRAEQETSVDGYNSIIDMCSGKRSRRINAIKLRVRRRVYVEFGGNATSDEQF